MLTILYQAIQLNNYGAVHLNAQNVGDAIRAFREGFLYLKHAAAVHEQDDQIIREDSPSGLTNPVLIQVYKLEQGQPATANIPITTTYYFSHPLLLDENIDLSTSTIATQQRFHCVTNQISAVMLFNFALAHHRQGMRQARADLCRSAVRIYNSAIDLLRPVVTFWGNQWQHSLSTCFPHLLILLSLNNTAQIYYDEFCDYDLMSAVCVDMKRMICDSLLLSDSSVPLLLSVGETDALTVNATMLCSPSAAGAA